MRVSLLTVVVLGTGVLGAVGCAKEAPPPPAAVPHPVPQSASAAPGALAGTVLETLDAPGYTYLRLRTAAGEAWAAIPTAAIAVGATVALDRPMPMQNFTSKTLNRTFPEIFFCSGATSVGGAPVAKAAPADPKHDALLAWAGKGAPLDRAAGPDAKTVAEVHLQRTALKDKTVTVRGRVVKVTSGVLGKNWLHLQDGSGAPDTRDHDLVVTTTDEAAIGDVVSVRGPLHLERDFGAGYVFAVMVEDAKISR